ncbi:origin recognition complex subunit 6-domain-containing protein [Dendryphion nanum]|uniref:Origin recognition complex subunit 6-domain-containing protein n=1 Tax=Dendryphion nanum TaxID=256645 RepID=A0A9P9D1G0_9PLEO|nr:origin recognition complex subunit 6-domain-containing protein [Dendryphion nanum]
MNKSTISQALTGLLPTLNGPLPPELVDLGVSLLARSRSAAQTLKQDEEIARPYACAQLACERLKKRLNLPPITSRPPCPPRIYKKLYTYLESALPASNSSRSTDPETPRKSKSAPSTSARNTPKTPLSARKTPRSVARHGGRSRDPPEWTMPAIRSLLKAFKYPAAAPHVYTGVESTLPLLAMMDAAASANAPETPSKRPRRTTTQPSSTSDELSDARILTLVSVILFFVLSRMQDQDLTPEQFGDWQNKAVETAVEIKEEVEKEEVLTGISELLPVAQAEGWLNMEWYLNVEPVADGDVEGDEMEGVEMSNVRKSLKDAFGGRSEHIGLGTMIQDATDYLSEGQKADYERWKEGILARVEQIEAAS